MSTICFVICWPASHKFVHVFHHSYCSTKQRKTTNHYHSNCEQIRNTPFCKSRFCPKFFSMDCFTNNTLRLVPSSFPVGLVERLLIIFLDSDWFYCLSHGLARRFHVHLLCYEFFAPYWKTMLDFVESVLFNYISRLYFSLLW